jgi:hypothetical protein
MADKGSNTWLWWSIGGIATLGLGLGIYYYIQGKRDDKKKNEDSSKPPITNDSSNPPVYTNSTPPPITTTQQEVIVPKSTPFTSVEQSNAFRKWVNDNYSAFAKEIDLDPFVSTSSSMNNSTIQKAWGKLSDVYYTENSSNLGVAMRIATGATSINGGINWKSSDSIPRGEITMYTDGKITANGINAQGAQTKFVQGGWYKSGTTYYMMIGGANYASGIFNLRNDFWNILKKAGIFNDSTNTYSAFNANMGTTKFGLATDGTRIQDEIL